MGYGIGMLFIGMAWVAGACHLYIWRRSLKVEGYNTDAFFGEGRNNKASLAPWIVIPLAAGSWFIIMGIVL